MTTAPEFWAGYSSPPALREPAEASTPEPRRGCSSCGGEGHLVERPTESGGWQQVRGCAVCGVDGMGGPLPAELLGVEMAWRPVDGRARGEGRRGSLTVVAAKMLAPGCPVWSVTLYHAQTEQREADGYPYTSTRLTYLCHAEGASLAAAEDAVRVHVALMLEASAVLLGGAP